MLRTRIALLISLIAAMPLSPAFSADNNVFAQLDCGVAKRLYRQAHEFTCLQQFEEAIVVLEGVRASVPRGCRMESDSMLALYISNIRSLIAQKHAGGPPTPCRPIQTGPLSYTCWTNFELTEVEKDMCHSITAY